MATTRPTYYAQSRFANNKGVQEGNFAYNSNDLDVVVVAEGPHPSDMAHAASFVQNLAARGITHQMAAGNPLHRRKLVPDDMDGGFLDLTNPQEAALLSQQGIQVEVERFDRRPQSQSSAGFATVTFSKADGSELVPGHRSHAVHYMTLSAWGDYKAERFNEDTIHDIHFFVKAARNGKLGVNCTAGLGRSGVIALALQLDNIAILKNLAEGEAWPLEEIDERLGLLRDFRPGLVQTDEQKALAIALAYQFHLLDQGLQLIDMTSLMNHIATAYAQAAITNDLVHGLRSAADSLGYDALPIVHAASSTTTTSSRRVNGYDQLPQKNPTHVARPVCPEDLPSVPSKDNRIERVSPNNGPQGGEPATLVLQPGQGTLLKNLIGIIEDDAFWRHRQPGAKCNVPRGILNMRKSLQELVNVVGGDEERVDLVSKANQVWRHADKRLRAFNIDKPKSALYLFTGIGNRRDRFTDNFYKLCEYVVAGAQPDAAYPALKQDVIDFYTVAKARQQQPSAAQQAVN